MDLLEPGLTVPPFGAQEKQSLTKVIFGLQFEISLQRRIEGVKFEVFHVDNISMLQDDHAAPGGPAEDADVITDGTAVWFELVWADLRATLDDSSIWLHISMLTG